MKITPQTTLAELDVERMRLGITSMLTTLKTERDSSLVVEVMLIATDGVIKAEGRTIPAAIDKAFQLREEQIAEVLKRYEGGPQR